MYTDSTEFEQLAKQYDSILNILDLHLHIIEYLYSDNGVNCLHRCMHACMHAALRSCNNASRLYFVKYNIRTYCIGCITSSFQKFL